MSSTTLSSGTGQGERKFYDLPDKPQFKVQTADDTRKLEQKIELTKYIDANLIGK